MLKQISRWLGRTLRRAWDKNLQWWEHEELTNLNDHLLADIGCSQKSAEHAAERKVRSRIQRLASY